MCSYGEAFVAILDETFYRTGHPLVYRLRHTEDSETWRRHLVIWTPEIVQHGM